MTELPRGGEKICRSTERSELSQCKMVMGFCSPVAEPDEAVPALRLFCALFGGTPHSRLFLNVREKLSLCYYCMMGPYRVSRFLAGAFVLASIVLLIVFRKRRSIFGAEGLRLQNEAIEAEKAKKAEEKSAKTAASSKIADDDAFTDTDALTEDESADTQAEEKEEEEPAGKDGLADGSVPADDAADSPENEEE